MKFVRFGDDVLLLHNVTYFTHKPEDADVIQFAKEHGLEIGDWHKERLLFFLTSSNPEGADYVEVPLDRPGAALFWEQISSLPNGVVVELYKIEEETEETA